MRVTVVGMDEIKWTGLEEVYRRNSALSTTFVVEKRDTSLIFKMSAIFGDVCARLTLREMEFLALATAEAFWGYEESVRVAKMSCDEIEFVLGQTNPDHLMVGFQDLPSSFEDRIKYIRKVFETKDRIARDKEFEQNYGRIPLLGRIRSALLAMNEG